MVVLPLIFSFSRQQQQQQYHAAAVRLTAAWVYGITIPYRVTRPGRRLPPPPPVYQSLSSCMCLFSISDPYSFVSRTCTPVPITLPVYVYLYLYPYCHYNRTSPRCPTRDWLCDSTDELVCEVIVRLHPPDVCHRTFFRTHRSVRNFFGHKKVKSTLP